MKKFVLFGASLVLIMGMAISAMATPVPAGTKLTVSAGMVTSPMEDGLASGSGFAMGDGMGGMGQDGWTALSPGTDGGIILGITQPLRAIDAMWMFFNAGGLDFTTSAPSADTNGGLDLIGWTANWGGGNIPLGSLTDYVFTATSAGTYTIHGGHVISHPLDPNFMFNGVVYTLHLEGNIDPAIDLCAGVICDDLNPCTTDSCDPIAGCINTPIADCTCEKQIKTRGGGQRPTTTDLQIQTQVTVTNDGCIVDVSANAITLSQGTCVVVNCKVGNGPAPDSATLNGAAISPDSIFNICCDGTGPSSYKLYLSNTKNGGKDTDRITIQCGN